MNRKESLKQIDASYNYYYSPSTAASSSYYSSSSKKGSFSQPHQSLNNSQTASPLTLENVSKVLLADPSSMPLARYCSDMEISSPESVYSPSITSTKRKILRRPQQDKVLESPRLLPFPYHNDSYFLPTAEHDHPGGGCLTNDASSSIASLSIRNMGSHQQVLSHSVASLYHAHRGYQRQLLSPPSKSHLYSAKRYDDDDTASNYSNKRKAASVTLSLLREDDIVPQKKRRSNNKFAIKFKQNLLRFKSNSPILECNNNNTCSHYHGSSSASAIIPNILISTPTNDTTKVKQKHKTSSAINGSWYEKLWKLIIKPRSLVKRNKKSTNRTRAATAATGPVWYSQFRCNPPPPTGITLLS